MTYNKYNIYLLTIEMVAVIRNQGRKLVINDALKKIWSLSFKQPEKKRLNLWAEGSEWVSTQERCTTSLIR